MKESNVKRILIYCAKTDCTNVAVDWWGAMPLCREHMQHGIPVPE